MNAATFERLETRRFLTATPPSIGEVRVWTTDAATLEISYVVTGNSADSSFPLNVYRTPNPAPGSGQVPIAQLTMQGSDGTNGGHTITISPPAALAGTFRFNQALALRPDPTHNRVLAVLDQTGALNPADASSAPHASFRVWLLGAVTHGYTFSKASSTFPSVVAPPVKPWVEEFAKGLVADNAYDDAVWLHWESSSNQPGPGYIEQAAVSMENAVIQAALALKARGGSDDIVAIHFIGHSRGSVVNSIAAQLVLQNGLLKNSFVIQTFLDPHPASAAGEFNARDPNNVGLSSSTYRPEVLARHEAEYLVGKLVQFQTATNDPLPTLACATVAEEYFQNTPASEFAATSLTNPGSDFFNLWGLNPMLFQAGVFGVPFHVADETPLRFSHTDVRTHYYSDIIVHGRTLGSLGMYPFGSNRTTARGPVGRTESLTAPQAAAPQTTTAAPTALVVTKQPPASVTAGSPITLTVAAVNGTATSTTYTGAATVAEYNGAVLIGTTGVHFVKGVATFSLAVATAGDESSLLITSGSLGVYTKTFDVAAGSAKAVSLKPLTQNVLTGAPFGVMAFAVDAYGNGVSTFTGPITLSLGTSPAGATLAGARTVAAINGSATFTGLTIGKAGTATLKAVAPGLTSAASPSFSVLGRQLLVKTAPPVNVVAGRTFSVSAAVTGPNGATDTTYTGVVTLKLISIDNAAVVTTLTATAAHGVATFSMAVSSGGIYAVAFTTPGVGSAGTSDFLVIATAVVSGFAFTDTNKNGQYDSDEPLTPGRVIYLDANNNGLLDAGEASVVTGTYGLWSFAAIPPGIAHVREVLPSGYVSSTAPINLAVLAGQTYTALALGVKAHA